MKVHLRADSADGTHTKFTVFMNGANCGKLCMREEEAVFFHQLVMCSTWPSKTFNDEVVASGRWGKEADEDPKDSEEKA